MSSEDCCCGKEGVKMPLSTNVVASEAAPPSFKEQKYDRQLRLWGSSGQAALEHAKICVLNASGVATETLKNLVLPGVGSFTIVSDAIVTEGDLGNNFFATVQDLGSPLAKSVTSTLAELNPDVKGTFLLVSPAELIRTRPNYFAESGFTLVIATQLDEPLSLELSSILLKANIPLILVRCCGLFGYLRLDIGSLAVVETFSERQVEDMRITQPFPALAHFVDSIGDPAAIEDTLQHAHIPYVALLCHYFAKWKAANPTWNGGELTYKQRKEIGALVTAGKRSDTEQNFDEAVAKLSVLNPPEMEPTTKEILASPELGSLGPSTDPFWFCVAALRKFREDHHHLPLTGALADMTATTEWFVALKAAYAEQAQKDLAEIAATISSLVRAHGGAHPPEIPAEYIAAVVRNVWALRFLRCRPLGEECTTGASTKAVASGLANHTEAMMGYLLMRAGERFRGKLGRYPGEGPVDAPLEEDVAQLKRELTSLLAELGIPYEVDGDYVHEWTRYGAAELHNISAVMGGVASQEALKLLTRQRAPLCNTLVFSGVSCTFSTFDL
eukprot:RCo005067